jgi:N-acetylmuramoyl-L-alanine amidase CwlA
MKIWLQKHKYMLLFSILLILSFIGFMNFKKIIDRTVKQRTMPIEYLVVHWTANTATGADARANAIYLKKKENAGTHYCIDDEEIYQCTEDKNVAYSVGGKYWSGFVPKMWLARKIFNNNSLNFEMCLGGDRNDSIVIDHTAELIGKKLVQYGLDITRVVRHYDVLGKPCPRFCYADTNSWDNTREDSAFASFTQKVHQYQQIYLFRKRIWKETGEWRDTFPPYIGHTSMKFTVTSR